MEIIADLVDLLPFTFFKAIVALFGFLYLVVLAVKFIKMLIWNAWKCRRLKFEKYNWHIG